MTTLVCTLFEGSHGIGAGALVNSLHRSGFVGEVVCAHRGPRPAWAESASALEPLHVTFLEIGRPEHLTYLKPWLMLQILERSPEIDKVAYLDPDVVVKCSWSVLDSWMQASVAAVEDVNGNIPSRHPLRLQWRDFLQDQGLSVECERSVYVNAGFLGLSREHADLLKVWWDVVQRSATELGGLTALKNRGPNDLFHSADQDALNMALEVVPCPLNWVGPEGMDFVPGGSLLSHAIGQPKPWQARALRRALAGYPPAVARSEFLRYVSSPLAALPTGDVRRLRCDLQAAKALSRIVRRGS